MDIGLKTSDCIFWFTVGGAIDVLSSLIERDLGGLNDSGASLWSTPLTAITPFEKLSSSMLLGLQHSPPLSLYSFSLYKMWRFIKKIGFFSKFRSVFVLLCSKSDESKCSERSLIVWSNSVSQMFSRAEELFKVWSTTLSLW